MSACFRRRGWTVASIYISICCFLCITYIYTYVTPPPLPLPFPLLPTMIPRPLSLARNCRRFTTTQIQTPRNCIHCSWTAPSERSLTDCSSPDVKASPPLWTLPPLYEPGLARKSSSMARKRSQDALQDGNGTESNHAPRKQQTAWSSPGTAAFDFRSKGPPFPVKSTVAPLMGDR